MKRGQKIGFMGEVISVKNPIFLTKWNSITNEINMDMNVMYSKDMAGSQEIFRRKKHQK